MIKAVFIDIDGTILNSNRKITENTKRVIDKCISKKIKIILASGRSAFETLNYQKKLRTSPYIISSNGASVYNIKKNMEIFSEKIEVEDLQNLLLYSLEHNLKITLNYKTELVMNMNFYVDEEEKVRTVEELKKIILNENIIQCVIASRELNEIVKVKEYLSKNKRVKIENESKRIANPNLMPSNNYYCDIVSSKVSKGKAVDILCKYLNLEKDEIVVIGDGINDISMFEQTPNSIAMENAVNEVKRRANYITTSNDEEGVANVLEKIIINKGEFL